MDQPDIAPVKHAAELSAAHPADLVSLFSMDDRCRYASPSHESILGYTPKQMIGKLWTEVVAPEDHAHADLAGNDAILNGQSIEFGLRGLTKSGERVPLRGTARIIVDPATHDPYLLFQATVVKT